MNVPITQSEMWHKLQQDLNETSYLTTEKDYQYLAILKTTPVGKYLYLPYGPVAETKQGMKAAFHSLKSLANKENAIFIRVEPQEKGIVPDLKFIPTRDLNPKETWLLDLSGTDEELKKKLPSRLLRYHRNAEKNGIKIVESHDPEDIKHLLKLQTALAKEKGINTFEEKYLKTEAAQPFSTIYLVEYTSPETKKTDIVAAGMVFDDKTTRYNLQGAQNDQGRKIHATGILTIQLILDAKKKKLKTFDFWGIAPEGAPANHPWAGFTNFKKTFAGYEKDYFGTHDLILSKPKYYLYNALRSLNLLIRRKK